MYRETNQSERLYSKIAKRYDAVFERAILSEGRLTDLTRRLMEGRHVLDLACGNGRWLDRFNPDEYTGLDLNEQMLDEAQLRYPHVQFVRGDMTAIPFAAQSFDGVLSMFGAMGHLPSDGQQRMIGEIHRVLQPDGVAILTNGNAISPFALPVTVMGSQVKLEGVRFKVQSTTPRRFTSLLTGFKLLQMESYDYSFIPMFPIKFAACLLGRDYKLEYNELMRLYDNCAAIPSLRWFGKQLVAVCQKV